MEITVQCFGQTRDYLGGKVIGVTLHDVATVDDLLALLAARDAGLAELLPHCAVAIGEDMVPRTHALHAGDEVALLPPVNGGC